MLSFHHSRRLWIQVLLTDQLIASTGTLIARPNLQGFLQNTHDYHCCEIEDFSIHPDPHKIEAMVSVASLLNPSPSPSECNSMSSSASRSPSPFSLSLLPSKKSKVSKGAATFIKGKPKGEVNYPPFEKHDNITAAEYHKFDVKPVGRISEYPKRIPYNSEKKSFQKKTGRDGFEGKRLIQLHCQ